MKPLFQRLTNNALDCAAHADKPFGVYVQSRFFAGGFGFNSAAEAATYVQQQLAHAVRDDERSDFRAAIADASTGRSISLYS